MIDQCIYSINLTRDEIKSLIAIKEWSGKMWNKPPNDEIEAIKLKIRNQLEVSQTRCAYCGLELGGTSGSQIEHIAPKAYFRYPEFTFTTLNLVLACGYCNGFEKKGAFDTISSLHTLYKKCTFNIVHPYLDDPKDHYEWDDQQESVLISVRNNSQKGINSIELFKLDSPAMSEHRARQIRFEELKRNKPIGDQEEQLVQDIINN